MSEIEDDIVGDHARVIRGLSTMSMRLTEIIQRRQEEQHRREADGQREAAQALRDRESVQAQASHDIARLGLDGQWREGASDRALATAFVHAEAYRESDEVCRLAYRELSEHIEGRHGEVAAFVDAHLSEDDLHHVPAPEGALSPSAERAAERAAVLTPEENEMRRRLAQLAIGEDVAGQWATLVQGHGRDRADEWLVSTLNEEEMATVRTWELWADADRERTAAGEVTAEAEVEEAREDVVPGAGASAEMAREDAEEHEARADLAEALGNRVHAGRGEFPHSRSDIDALRERSPEAARALEVTMPGRTRSAAAQVARASGNGVRTNRKSRATGQEAAPERDLGR